MAGKTTINIGLIVLIMWFVGTLVYRKLCGYLKVFHSFCPFIVSFTRVKKYDVKSVLYENVFHTCFKK